MHSKSPPSTSVHIIDFKENHCQTPISYLMDSLERDPTSIFVILFLLMYILQPSCQLFKTQILLFIAHAKCMTIQTVLEIEMTKTKEHFFKSFQDVNKKDIGTTRFY